MVRGPMTTKLRKPLVGPFIGTMVAAAFLFAIGVLLAGPFAKIIVAASKEGISGLSARQWGQLVLVTGFAGVVWTSFWIAFKRGEKKVIEALDERGEYWWLRGRPREKADSSRQD
jgi:uncharacterized membrane protein